MKKYDKIIIVALIAVIAISVCLSIIYMSMKHGYHEDELLTYSMANTSKQLETEGEWNIPKDFMEYLSAGEHRFDYANAYQNQVNDSAHPPLYYMLVHTVCSLFPGSFEPWFAFSINVIMMVGALILLYQIGKFVAKNKIYALIAVGGYALSIACITTTIYLRMYAMLTFFVLAFLYITMFMYSKKEGIKIYHYIIMFITVVLGILTHYYFILYAGLIGLVYLVFQLKQYKYKDLLKYIITAILGAGVALAIYPYIISNVLGGSRGLGSLELNIDFITIVTYVIYKLFTYIEILAKDLFVGQTWLLVLYTVGIIGFAVYYRVIKKRRLPKEAMFIIIPGFVAFLIISLITPFNSDRYVMASLPLISMVYTFVLIKMLEQIRNIKVILVLPIVVILVSTLGLIFVRPYYIYGKTNLYEPRTSNCLFVGTDMKEWNKCIDKLIAYDSTMIVKTDKMSKTLYEELDNFAQKRGIVTNGKISSIVKGFMGNIELSNSLPKVIEDAKIKNIDEITVYISTLADKEFVIEFLLNNTEFKNYELIQADSDFEQFYNWYEYFVETEAYCSVYLFSI